MTNRMVLGALGGGAFGLKVSMPGVDSLTASNSDPAQWSFHSEWPGIANIYGAGTVQAGSAVNHNLGYVPWADVRHAASSGSTTYRDDAPHEYQDGVGSGTGWDTAQAVVTTTTLIGTWFNGAAPVKSTALSQMWFHYFILRIPVG